MLLAFSRKSATWIALTMASAVLHSGAPVQSEEYRVGLFFDEGARSCVGEIRNYDNQGVEAHIFAFVPDGTAVNGALVGIELPPGLILRSLKEIKDANYSGDMTSPDGLDITLVNCPVASGPVMLGTLDLIQVDDRYPESPRIPDIALWLRGGVTEADSLKFERPQVKVCDPDDPIGGTPELVEALSFRATLNCSSDCPCVTGIEAKTWGWVKRRFKGP
jgi:hypothetical protein